MYGSSRRLLMQEYVQKFTTMTFPRRSLAVNGGELSHPTAPSSSGSRPSSVIPDAIAPSTNRRAAAPGSKARFLRMLRFRDCRGDYAVLHLDVAGRCQRVRTH